MYTFREGSTHANHNGLDCGLDLGGSGLFPDEQDRFTGRVWRTVNGTGSPVMSGVQYTSRMHVAIKYIYCHGVHILDTWDQYVRSSGHDERETKISCHNLHLTLT